MKTVIIVSLLIISLILISGISGCTNNKEKLKTCLEILGGNLSNTTGSYCDYNKGGCCQGEWVPASDTDTCCTSMCLFNISINDSGWVAQKCASSD